jgi:tRNA threonylcarbamoyladenosine biosynthesis protein TsaE
MKRFASYSSKETTTFGAELAADVLAGNISSPRGGLVIALEGELGAGKTTFVQGFMRGLGIKRKPNSPTFVIMRRYPVRSIHFKNVYHIDAYRITTADAIGALGLRELMADPKNIILIEWADKLKKALPTKSIRLRFRHGKKEHERVVIY